MVQHIEQQIREFIAENFLFQDNADSLAGDESLLEGGVIDSTGVLELVGFLEEHFQLRIADAEVLPANFDSIDALVSFVSAKIDVAPQKVGVAAAS
jgi:acyl carrier protein